MMNFCLRKMMRLVILRGILLIISRYYSYNRHNGTNTRAATSNAWMKDDKLF